MRIVLFYHSLVSDWNHGNAHFLRGVVRELAERGHEPTVYEPRHGWSRTNLVREHGLEPLRELRRRFPELRSRLYDDGLDLERALEGADLVLAHEWNDPQLVRGLGEARAHGSFRLLFHDTHHRALTAPKSIEALGIERFDGVLAYGRVIAEIYRERGWARRAWTWHEAADVRSFRPVIGRERQGDLVWIGNWGDGERTQELEEFLIGPARALELSGSVFGVRYPDEAKRALAESGLAYRGWIANYEVPKVFAEHAVTVHVPRRPYAERLPGIPTIRPFEALACGIPLVSAPWDDAEQLFSPGEDFLVAHDGDEMQRHLRSLLDDPARAGALAQHGLRTIHTRHTCAHRVDELLAICAELGLDPAAPPAAARAARGPA